MLAPSCGVAARTILVADDALLVRAMICKTLRRAGYTVLEASCAEEAECIAQSHPEPIHLLLADVTLPKITGEELGRRLRSFRPGLRVLCVSGYPHEDLLDDGILDPDTPFIRKPWKMEELFARVRELTRC